MFESVLSLLWGLGLFLYGINLMSEKTEKAFGNHIKRFLEKTADTKIKSIITGAAITALIQSSSAVTVTLVSLIENGIISLFQAVGIIMGANIGTTVTSLLIAFDFSDIAPIFILSGAIMKLFSKKEKFRYSGEAILGFGVLFLGLTAMSEAFSSLKDSSFFSNMLISASGKTGGILSGILMTVIIQSSSATVGILQGLCDENLVTLTDAVYIVLGQNIGTVITVILASVGRSKKAKQIGKIHLIFNIVGCIFFVVLCEFFPIGQWLTFLNNPSLAVSVFHIIFNVVNIIILVPFYDKFVTIKE